MKQKSLIVRVGGFLLDLVELYVPMATFTMMFLLFLVSIFFRYFLNNPLGWPFEMTIIGFIYTAVLAATYVRRQGSHVKFTLVYERLSERGQRVSRILANTLVMVAFAWGTPTTIEWIIFMDFKATTFLGISFSIVYFPIVPFLILIAAHSLYDIVVDIRRLLLTEQTS
jgi:TRAP-type C4-dicarboxylate transport system permease small subunit